MKTLPSPKSPPGLRWATPATPQVMSSDGHRWQGALAIESAGTPTGECRHEHKLVTLQLWWQPFLVRPLRGPGTWRTVAPGARLWLPGEEQYFEWRQSGRTNMVLMAPERIEQVLQQPYSKVNLERWRGLDFVSPFVSRLIEAISDDMANDCPAGPLAGDSLMAALIAYLEAGPIQPIPAQTPSPQGFARALEYIDANLSEHLRLNELANEAGCSPKQLSRAFRERLGVLPHQHVLARRIQRAMSLIDGGHHNLADVAVLVGFADQSQLTKMFRKLLGTTPGRFQKRPND